MIPTPPTRRLSRILVAGSLSVLLLAGLTPGQAVSDEPAPADALAEWAPEGTVNVARGAAVATSSSYQMSGESWDQAFLVDGLADATRGWSTDPYAMNTTPTTPATVDLTLSCAADVSRIVVFPREKSFPADYHFEITADGEQWETFPGSTGHPDDETEPQVHDLDEPVRAATVRLVVDRRNGTPPDASGRNGHLVQLSEIAVFGTEGRCLDPGKPAVLLEPGQRDILPWQVTGDPDAEPEWATSDASVATVADGVITAVGVGSATVTMAVAGLSASVAVTVEEDVQLPGDDDIVVAAFWAPTPEYINDEQYGYMAEAGIDFIQNVNGNELNARSTNLLMAELAHRHGMHVGVADDVFGEQLQSMSREEIEREVRRYLNVPGVGGFYLKDEPVDALPWADAFNAVEDIAPDYHTHLNFFPYFFYGSIAANNAQMQAWAEAVGKRDYLMYDMYPFRDNGAFDAAGFHANLDAVRRLGLANEMRTGNYLQSVGIPGNLRRPTADEIRFEVNATLAYGFKQLSWFTWWQPTNRGEVFTEAIMTADGQKTDLYEPVKQLNSEIHALSPVMGGLDALEVYLSGQTHGRDAVPGDFFVQPVGDADLILSYLRDPDTGRNYLMVVNQDFTAGTDVELTFADGIGALEEISRADGSATPVALADGTLTTTLDAGGAALYALPADFDHEDRPTVPNTNLALHRGVEADNNHLGDKWMAGSITDGQRFTGADARGWRTVPAEECAPATATIDLRREQRVNRVDVYPAGTVAGDDYAATFPETLAVEVSADGADWTPVAALDEQVGAPTSLTFDDVDARYVRLVVTGVEGDDGLCSAALRQVEVFHDDGDTPAPDDPPRAPADNIAFGKSVEVSSFPPLDPYATWGWAPAYLVDGDTSTGWTSQPGRNTTPDATEWATVDLGEQFSLEQIVLKPRGHLPIDYVIEVSPDGETWTTVADVTGETADPAPRTTDVDVEGRFVRITGTRLPAAGADGHLMQIGELEVYGEPVDVEPTPTPTPDPTSTPTPDPTSTPTPDPTSTPKPDPTVEPTTTPTTSPTATATPAPTAGVPYEVPGFHQAGGRWWYTVCEPYSQTTRCRTSIWATQVAEVDGRHVSVTGWHFNNLTYLPTMTRAQWQDNPLGRTGEWTSDEGRRWRTECDTAATGRNGCRSYVWTRYVASEQGTDGAWTHRTEEGWVFNNLVKFRI